MSTTNDIKAMPKLNPEFKAKWLEALRSGKYKQTTGVLRSAEGFCCLGVACDLVDPDSWSTPNDFGYTHGAARTTAIPGNDVQKAMFGDWFIGETFDPLTSRNDGGEGRKRQSFKQLANLIERHL
jgi:hypothetical protein